MLAPYYEYRCFRWNKRRRRTEACLKAGASKSVSDRCRIIKGGILIAGTINNLCVQTQLKTWRDKEFVWLFLLLKTKLCHSKRCLRSPSYFLHAWDLHCRCTSGGTDRQRSWVVDIIIT